jgi:hypothetical protein
VNEQERAIIAALEVIAAADELDHRLRRLVVFLVVLNVAQAALLTIIVVTGD